MLGQDRLGMELHTFDRKRTVTHCHDQTVRRFGRDLKIGRERFALDDQRMVAAGVKASIDIFEYRFPIMSYLNRFSVHRFRRAYDAPTEMLTDRLMAEA